MASLGDKIDGLTSEMRRYNAYRRAEQQRAKVPSDVWMPASVTIPTPTARTGMSFGGPSAGFYWLLRRLVIGGVTFKTTASGTAEVYVSGLGGELTGTAVTGPIVSALALTELVDIATSLPQRAYYSNRQVIVQAQQNLIVVIDTGTAAQQYIGAAQFEVHRTLASEVSVIE